MTDNALAVQVGGDHYKDMAIQPVEFALANNLNTCQANIIKYVCRHGLKNGVEDLKKASHYCDLWVDIYEAHDKPFTSSPALWISVDEFIFANNLPGAIAVVIRLTCANPFKESVLAAKEVIEELILDLSV